MVGSEVIREWLGHFYWQVRGTSLRRCLLSWGLSDKKHRGMGDSEVLQSQEHVQRYGGESKLEISRCQRGGQCDRVSAYSRKWGHTRDSISQGSFVQVTLLQSGFCSMPRPHPQGLKHDHADFIFSDKDVSSTRWECMISRQGQKQEWVKRLQGRGHGSLTKEAAIEMKNSL